MGDRDFPILFDSPGETELSSSSTSIKTNRERDDRFRDTRMSFDSPSKFAVWMPKEAGGETRFVLQRTRALPLASLQRGLGLITPHATRWLRHPDQTSD